MFSKFNKQINTVFLDPESNGFNRDDTVNVILSPSLYWVKKISLPVKKIRDVKPLLASLFEDMLPQGTYSYSAYKNGDDFYIFAYQDKLILDTLEEKGLSVSQVKNIHFAQSELSFLDEAMKINDKQSIYCKDDIVILVPCCWIEEKGNLTVDTLTLSNNKITLKKFNHLIDEKSIYTLSGILFLFVIFLSIEIFSNTAKIDEIQKQREKLFLKNNLKATMIQNYSMLKSYNKTHTIQTNFRKYIGIILSLRLKKGQSLSLVNLKDKKMFLEFSGINKGEEVSIVNKLKMKKLLFKPSFKNNTLFVEITL